MRQAATLLSAPRLARIFVAAVFAVGFVVFATVDALPTPAQDAQLIEAGKAVFTDQCASCHGAEGKGDGPAARFLSPKPSDFTAGDWKYAAGGTVDAVVGVILNGVDDTGMTPFEGQLSDDEMNAVATYVVRVLVGEQS